MTTFFGLSSTSHSVRSAVSRPPRPTTIKMSGHRFQKIFGQKSNLVCQKIRPITTKAAGQKYALGMHSFRLSSIRTSPLNRKSSELSRGNSYQMCYNFFTAYRQQPYFSVLQQEIPSTVKVSPRNNSLRLGWLTRIVDNHSGVSDVEHNHKMTTVTRYVV